jgi:uncharacterized protein (UPF0210 family)
VEIRNGTAIDLAEALVDDQRLRFQILQVRIHPDASRESGKWFHTTVITGPVPVIPIRKAQRFTSSGWPQQVLP